MARGSLATAASKGFVLFGDNVAKPAAEEKAVCPISAPYYHEDSFVTTDLRAWYINHELSGGTIGGDVTVAALQVRVVLTESLQFVAYKDGYTDFDDDTALLGFDLRPLGDDFGLRAAYETQLNDDTSFFGYRWTFSVVYEF